MKTSIPYSKPNSKPTPALWAIDPFETENIPNDLALDQAKAHLGGSFEETTPIFVSSPYFVDLLTAEEKVRQYLQDFPTGPIRPPQVIHSKSDKKEGWVRDVLQQAEDLGARLIILTNHGRKGLSKLLVGSFAEQLLLESPIPILFMGQNPSETSKDNRVLFASDFSPEAKFAFFDFLQFTAGRTDELILFHAVSIPAGALTASQLGGTPAYFSDSFWEEHIEWAKKESVQWIEEAKTKGYQTRFHTVIQETLSDPGPSALHVADRENISLIGLISHGNRDKKLFFGSVTKSVLSSPHFEVWACGPKYRGPLQG